MLDETFQTMHKGLASGHRTSQMTNLIDKWASDFLQKTHVNSLFKISMQEGTFHIHLEEAKIDKQQ